MISYQRERDGVPASEYMPLLLRHHAEAEPHEGTPNPHLTDVALGLATGVIQAFSARDDGKLVGYVVYIVRTHLHYRDSLRAIADSFYIDEAYRSRCALGLLSFAERELRAEGVSVLYMSEKKRRPFSALLERSGYEPEENVWIKRLDREVKPSNVVPLPRLRPAFGIERLRPVPKELNEFAAWYFDGGIKLKPPADGLLFHHDSPGEAKVNKGEQYFVASLVLYREGQFQVELILGTPHTRVLPHHHDHVDSIEVMVSGSLALMVDGLVAVRDHGLNKRRNGMARDALRMVPICRDATHEGQAGPIGGCFMSVQMWHGMQPSHVGIEWQDDKPKQAQTGG